MLELGSASDRMLGIDEESEDEDYAEEDEIEEIHG